MVELGVYGSTLVEMLVDGLQFVAEHDDFVLVLLNSAPFGHYPAELVVLKLGEYSEDVGKQELATNIVGQLARVG